MPKKDSVSSEPMNSSGMTTTTPVRIGISALRSTWRKKTTVSGRPLARAVRT